MEYRRRWYDSYDEAIKAFDILKGLDSESKKRISEDLIKIVKQITELRREEDADAVLSLGIERVIGLYQQSVNERRWYDVSKELKYALRTMSTLSTDDFVNIMEGLSVSLDN